MLSFDMIDRRRKT